MSTINVTTDEGVELRVKLDGGDPPRFGTNFGSGVRQPANDTAWLRQIDDGGGGWIEREPTWGVTVACRGLEDGAGDVDVPDEQAWACLEEPCPNADAASVDDKLITAAGEVPDSNRRFALRFDFSRCYMGA